MRVSVRRLVAAFVTVLVALTLTSATGATAKAKKTTKKKTTKSVTKTTAKSKTVRQIAVPAGTTATTLKPVPKDYDPNGELTLAYAGAPTSLDPAKNSLTPFTYMLYDRLTTIDDNLNVKPMLATGWTFPAKDILEMTLRDDVVFEDGTKFDAAAVKANIERSKTIVGSTVVALLKNISSVEVVSPTVVRFHLTSGGTELPALFAQAPGEMISPKVIATGYSLDAGTRGGGSGPYVVDTFTPGDKVVYKQSPTVLAGKYWDKAAGLARKFTEVFVPTGSQRINAARSGDVDVAQVTGQDTYGAQQLINQGQLVGRHVVLQTTQLVMMMRQTRPPFDNATFRTAMQYAIDKVGFGKGLYNGDCTVADQFFSKTHWAHSPGVDALDYGYDHDKAQAMIKASGIFNPTFTIQANQLYLVPAQAVAGVLGDYGINAKVEVASNTDTSFRDGNADASVGTMSGQVDPTNILNTFYLAINNLAKDPDGSLAKEAAAASDPTISQAAAAKLFDDIFTKIAKQSVIVHICNTHQLWISKDPKRPANINDLGYTFSGLIDPRYLYVKK